MPQDEKPRSRAVIETIIMLVPNDRAIISMFPFSFLANNALLKTYPGRNKVEKSPKNIRICFTKRRESGIIKETMTVVTEKVTANMYHDCSLILFFINSPSIIN